MLGFPGPLIRTRVTQVAMVASKKRKGSPLPSLRPRKTSRLPTPLSTPESLYNVFNLLIDYVEPNDITPDVLLVSRQCYRVLSRRLYKCSVSLVSTKQYRSFFAGLGGQERTGKDGLFAKEELLRLVTSLRLGAKPDFGGERPILSIHTLPSLGQLTINYSLDDSQRGNPPFGGDDHFLLSRLRASDLILTHGHKFGAGYTLAKWRFLQNYSKLVLVDEAALRYPFDVCPPLPCPPLDIEIHYETLPDKTKAKAAFRVLANLLMHFTSAPKEKHGPQYIASIKFVGLGKLAWHHKPQAILRRLRVTLRRKGALANHIRETYLTPYPAVYDEEGWQTRLNHIFRSVTEGGGSKTKSWYDRVVSFHLSQDAEQC